jgi:hypothetical protein
MNINRLCNDTTTTTTSRGSSNSLVPRRRLAHTHGCVFVPSYIYIYIYIYIYNTQLGSKTERIAGLEGGTGRTGRPHTSCVTRRRRSSRDEPPLLS